MTILLHLIFHLIPLSPSLNKNVWLKKKLVNEIIGNEGSG